VVFLKKQTDSLGADVCIDAVGADASGNRLHGLLGKKLKLEAGSPIALHWAINSVKKGGVVSVVGVYGPTGNMVPIGNVVNKGITLRANQASVKRLLPRLIEPHRGRATEPQGDDHPPGRARRRGGPLPHLRDQAGGLHQACHDPERSGLMDRVAKAGAMTPIDPQTVVGWGVDADPRNDPTAPMRDRSRDDGPGMNWTRPPLQTPRVEILRSIEHNRLPAALGTSTPPKGVSGAIRRYAFRFSESQWAHWLLLIFADRVNMVEGWWRTLGAAASPTSGPSAA
jgi:hypothetical protein